MDHRARASPHGGADDHATRYEHQHFNDTTSHHLYKPYIAYELCCTCKFGADELYVGHRYGVT